MADERAELEALRALRAARESGDQRGELEALRALQVARTPAATSSAAAPPAVAGPSGPVAFAQQAVDATNSAIAQGLGAPVDAVNALLGLVGLDSPAPIGGSASIRQLQGFLSDNPDVTLATGASFAVPPLAPGMAAARVAPFLGRLGLGTQGAAGLGARGAARFGPTVAAAGAGGGAGGAVSEAMEGGSPREVAEAGLRSAGEMAAAEAAGLGLVSAAGRVAAPALGAMTETGRRALEFARSTPLPGSARAITGRPQVLPIAPADVAPTVASKTLQAVVDNLLPSRAVTQSRRRAVTNRVLDVAPGGQGNEVIHTLVKADTSDAALPRARTVAETAARQLGTRASRRLGFEAGDTSPRQFIARLFESDAAEQLQKRMGKQAFDDLRTVNLEVLLNQAVRKVDGRRVIDGERLLTAWNNLPETSRALYPKEAQQAIENFGAFAAVSSRVPDLARQGVITFGPTTASVGAGIAPDIFAAGTGATTDPALLGIGAGVSVLTARSLMNPRGLLNRWLTNETLPPDVIRTIGGQAVQTGTRAQARGLLDEED